MKRTIALCLAIFFLATSCGRESGGGVITGNNFQLDTVVTISLYGTYDKSLIDAAFDEIDRLEQLLSRKIAGSDPDRLAKAGGESFIPVSPDTIFLIEKGEVFSKLTGGLFDLTIGPLVSLWDISGGGHFPDDDERIRAMELVDYTQVSVESGEAMLEISGMEIDFGAIAKGYIADEVKSFLIENAVESGVINLGGDVVLIGEKPGTGNFSIGVQDPDRPTGKVMGVFEISDKALVSSGKCERFFMHDGKRYHHILNPMTGYPAENELLQVTVIADDGVTGEVLSTSAFLLGLDKGMEFIKNSAGASAIFITEDKRVYLSPGFNETFHIVNDEYSLEGEYN